MDRHNYRFLIWAFVMLVGVANAEPVATPAPAAPHPPSPVDPDITLKIGEINALVNLGVAQYLAQSAQAKIKAQLDRAQAPTVPAK